MDLRRARAPIALIMLLALGIWAGSAFADGVVTVATTVLTDTVPTDPTATSPSTDTTATTGTSTSPVTSTTPADTTTAPVVTTTTPAADTPAGGQAGASTTADTGSIPANDPGAGSNTPAAGTAGQTAAGTASAGAAAVKARRTHKVKTRRARSSGASVRGPRPLRAPVGGIVSKKKRHRHAASSSSTSSPTTQTSTTSTTGTTGTTTTAKANGSKAKSLHSSKGKHPTATGAAHANGGRDDVATAPIQPTRPPNEEHGAMGIETPRGRVSISPTGFHIGGSQRSIASVNGLLTAVLDTLGVLAALAAILGAGAVLSRVRRNRQAARRRARVVPMERRTRQELYAEARRRNIPGRSNMTKAQLELALYPPQPAREQHADRVQRVRGRRGRLPRIDGVDQLGQAK